MRKSEKKAKESVQKKIYGHTKRALSKVISTCKMNCNVIQEKQNFSPTMEM